MQRRPPLVALVALSAALAFAVGATAVTGLDPPSVTSGPGNTTDASANATSGGGPGGSDPGGVGLLGPVGGIYGVVAGLLPAVSPPFLLVVTALVVAGLALAGLRRYGSESDEPAEPEVRVDPETGDDGGTDAGPLVPDAAPDNEVYRAWRAMVRELDVPCGEATTPREFAREAIRAGAATEPVERLTDLFDRVRYGAAEPTEDREERARDALAALDNGGED
ncbi:DUF4129 domain-containing protein [Halorientalis pallida]|uniref:DUF4129 domain-containing protein n=1 Tax=Halorientalis pallida TaxID=2479928 RepID=A0A498KY43_9EURY|nr:DUF4129 domain-containing protein [Halorientalis pallida]RXK50158.1 DUF4129 domain-containing protein [Halorientalis pallida]